MIYSEGTAATLPGENSIVIVGGANQAAWELTAETQSVRQHCSRVVQHYGTSNGHHKP